MTQYDMVELSFMADAPEASHVRIPMNAVIRNEKSVWQLDGFYAGNRCYKLRFLPEQSGIYYYNIHGCVEAEGSFYVGTAKPGDHGLVRTQGTRFLFEDGTAFHPFGTTVYALFHQDDELLAETWDTLENAPFNKLRACLFPKYYDFNHDDPPLYPFEQNPDGSWDVHRPCFAFWDRLETNILRLSSLGIQTDLILFHSYDRWGFSTMSIEEDCVYLDYLLRRLSAFPSVWWSLGNEYDLCKKSIAHWEQLEEYIANHDPYRHLLSCHNALRLWDHSRPNITHVSIQSKALWRVNAWRQQYCKPVIIDEFGYEGNFPHTWGCLSAKELVSRFWRCCTTGAYGSHGETFYDGKSEIIWWSRGGRLHGESAPRIAFLKELIESLPGHLEGIDTPLEMLYKIPQDQRAEVYETLGVLQTLARALWPLSEEEASFYIDSEITYQGHIEDKAFLNYYDIRCSAWDTLHLPPDKHYRVELIDTWAMTRQTVMEDVSGDVDVALPCREYMAVLAAKSGNKSRD